MSIVHYDTAVLPRETIAAFDSFLADKGLSLDAIVVGGAALALLGVTDRPTRDVDVLHPQLPAGVVEASVAFAQVQGQRGNPLSDDWLNNGPSQLVDVLPGGWAERIEPVFEGAAVKFAVLGKPDLLKTKLFALCDRGTDLADCIALAPSAKELAAARSWVSEQDAHPGWPAHVALTLDDLVARLGHGV